MNISEIRPNQLADGKVYDNSVVCNRIGGADARGFKENIDPQFGEVWKQVMNGDAKPPLWRQEADKKFGNSY